MTEKTAVTKKSPVKETEISIMEVHRGRIQFLLKGETPLICNAMSAKVMQELLLPARRKNAAEKQSSLKHEPMPEFAMSFYSARDPESPTRVVFPATAFKAALMGAALDLPGSSKAQIGRLSYVESDQIPIYGIPEIMCSVTRCADIKRTPDIRTRMIIPEWAAMITVQYTKPILNETAIVNLLAAAGITQGIGDWRIQKGSGNYGGFSLVGADDVDFKRIVKTGGKAAQDKAIAKPKPYDSETENLLKWYAEEARNRGYGDDLINICIAA